MRTRSFSFRSVCVSLLVLGACQDLPTAVVSAPRAAGAAAYGSAGEHLGQVPFYCIQGRRVPAEAGGWQARLDTLFFPRAELDEGGRKVRFQYRRSTTDGKLLAAADCMVPYTEAALRRVDRFFGIQKDGAAEQFRARQEMITIQGCVTDGACLLDPLVIVAPPPEIPPCDACNQYPGGGGYGEGGGWGDWGGTGGETASPYDEGPLAWVACIGAGLTAIGGGMLSYVSVEQYYMAVRAYGSARLRYQYATTVPDQSQYYSEMLAAERNVNLMTYALAASATVTVGGLLGVVALCSPSVFLPTP